MKSIFSIKFFTVYFFSLLLALSASTCFSQTYLPGDIAPRGAPDGKLASDDLFLAVDFYSGSKTPSDQELRIADVHPQTGPDGVITQDDITLIFDHIQGTTNIDNQAPAPISLRNTTIDLNTINAEQTYGWLIFTGNNNSVEPSATVTAHNTITGQTISNQADESGKFNITMPTAVNADVNITVKDSSGNMSAPRTIKAIQNPGLPGAFPVGSLELDDPNGLILPPGTTSGATDAWAQIRYPATVAGNNAPVSTDVTTMPVVLVLHGGHEHCNVNITPCPSGDFIPNHEGYNYLLDNLASHGYLAISINASRANGGETGIGPLITTNGATLFLKYLDMLEIWNNKENGGETLFGIENMLGSSNSPFADVAVGGINRNMFVNRINMSNVGVAGHSAAGTAVATLYQTINDNVWHRPHSISAYAAIAPNFTGANTNSTDPMNINNSNYFMLLGARDGDQAIFSSFTSFEMSAISNRNAWTVYGANHNHFNTIWTAGEGHSWVQAQDDGLICYNATDILPAADQRNIALTSLTAFFQWHLKGIVPYKSVLSGDHNFSNIPNNKILNMQQEPSVLVLDNFEQAGADVLNTLGGNVISTGLTTNICSGPGNECNTNNHIVLLSNKSKIINWVNNGQYEINIPTGNKDFSLYNYLSFRVSNQDISSVTAESVNIFLNLVDTSGRQARWDINSEQYAQLLKAYEFESAILSFPGSGKYTLFDEIQSNQCGLTPRIMRHFLSSVRVPLSDFNQNNSNVDLTSIEKIILRFEGQGSITLDDIELTQ